jgi:hypothetical protein
MSDAFRAGDAVVYLPYDGATAEDGVVVRTNETYVFVLYRGDDTPKATRPEDLTLARYQEARGR